jgi:hydrogenase/urease accessory protein HupE
MIPRPRRDGAARAALGARAAVTAAIVLIAAPALAHPLVLDPQPPPTGAYFALGVEHIVLGIDHLLFLLGLVVAATRLRDVLWAVTAFTLAHSATLALAALGFVAPDPAFIEPLIALSIAYVGFENLLGRARPSRELVAFGFGLLHGLGFAGALAEVGLPVQRSDTLLALLWFNAGVEAGQLALLAGVLPLLFRLRRFEPVRRFGLPALGAGLVAVGLLWAGARLPALAVAQKSLSRTVLRPSAAALRIAPSHSSRTMSLSASITPSDVFMPERARM